MLYIWVHMVYVRGHAYVKVVLSSLPEASCKVLFAKFGYAYI